MPSLHFTLICTNFQDAPVRDEGFTSNTLHSVFVDYNSILFYCSALLFIKENTDIHLSFNFGHIKSQYFVENILKLVKSALWIMDNFVLF
jgi:hypothetical protein